MGTDTIFWATCRANRGTDTIFGPGNRTFDRPDLPKRWPDGQGPLWCPDVGTDTMSGVPIGKVQRPTFNSQLSTGWPKGRTVGGIWGQTRCLGALGFGFGLAESRLQHASKDGDNGH